MPIKHHTPTFSMPWKPSYREIEESIPAYILTNYVYFAAGSIGGSIASRFWKDGHDVVIVKSGQRSSGILINKKEKSIINIMINLCQSNSQKKKSNVRNAERKQKSISAK